MDELFDAEGNWIPSNASSSFLMVLDIFSVHASQELVDANFLRKRM